MPEQMKAPPPLTDAEIREALRLQSATIRALMEMLRAKGVLYTPDVVKIKELRDFLAAQAHMQEERPQIVPPGKPN